MKHLFLVLSAVITVVAVLPYLHDVARRKTKPRVVSWFNWSIITGISAAAALADKQYPSAVLSLADCIECMCIVFFALKLGDRKFELFDVACQLGAIIGLLLWIIFNSPIIAIIASAGIDFVAGLPTMRHIWRKPIEESMSVFVLSGLGGLFALLAVQHPRVSGLIMPVYITLLNMSVVALFLLTPQKQPKRAR